MQDGYSDASELYRHAIAAFKGQDWPQAVQLSMQLLSLAPNHPGSQYILGVSCLEQRQLAMALRHLRRAVELEPQQPEFIAQCARALSTARITCEAQTMADRARSLSPLNAMTLSILGKVYEDSNQHDLALDMFRVAAELEPAAAHRRYNLASSLISMGDIAGAQFEIEQCLLLNPQFWKAHLALAHLQRQSVDANHLQRLTSLLSKNESDHDARICLHMAISKEYEDLAMYPEAFDHLLQGKSESRKNIKYTIEQDELLFAALQRALPDADSRITGNASREPIFVFGMPRTGTTLVDRILSGHPDVYSAGELQNFGVVLRQAWGTAVPLWLDTDIANRARNVDWEKVGARYIESTRPLTGHSPFFVDKLPHNFLFAGFIANALPNARMICLRRDPLDTCLSNFQQLFIEKLPYYHYSFDLIDTGKYYVLFDRLMQHWSRLFPGRILELRYEDLVNGQESTTRRLLDFCGLEWNEACLRFEKNRAAVGTASALQVREPLYSTSIGRWKHYQPQMADLLDLLKQSDIAFSR